MSDLSKPSLAVLMNGGSDAPASAPVTFAALPTVAPAGGVAGGTLWPTPNLSCYPAPQAFNLPPGCAIEGLSGHAIKGLLNLFAPDQGLVHVLIAPQRKPASLRLDQFRRLCLTEPLTALAPTGGDDSLTSQRMALPFTVVLGDNQTWQGTTVGHHEDEWGLYLFEPLDDRGSLRRWFVPHAAYSSAKVGMRLGEALVEQNSASPEQIRAALA